LEALEELYVLDSRSTVSKREAIGYIAMRHWFALEAEDREPYPSQRFTASEPRWQTLIAWARKDSVLHDFVSYESRDAWGLTRRGRDVAARVRELYRTRKLSVSPGFLWSHEFKLFMCPDHLASASDAKRPMFFYRDALPNLLDELYD
jgi:hypothetical protein